MKEEIAMIYKIALSLVLLVLSNSAFAQKYDSIEVSNSKESEELNISSVGFLTDSILCINIVKTIPLYETVNKAYFEFEYLGLHPLPSKQSILKLYFKDEKFLKGVFEKRAVKKIFNGFFKKTGVIKREDISIEHFLVENNKVEGSFKIKLPFNFGWLDSDTLVKVDFKTRIIDTSKQSTRSLPNPGLSKSFIIQADSFTNLDQIRYESCIIKNYKINSIPNIDICYEADVEYSSVCVRISNDTLNSMKVESVKSIDYDDMEGYKVYFYPYYKLVFNRDPFIESDVPLIGKYSIATDSLSRNYGDPEVRNGYFKCDFNDRSID